MKKRESKNGRNALSGFAHGAPDPGGVHVANVDPSLHGKSQRKPNRGCVKDLGHVLKHGLKSISGHFCAQRRRIAQGVDVEIPGKRCTIYQKIVVRQIFTVFSSYFY